MHDKPVCVLGSDPSCAHAMARCFFALPACMYKNIHTCVHLMCICRFAGFAKTKNRSINQRVMHVHTWICFTWAHVENLKWLCVCHDATRT